MNTYLVWLEIERQRLMFKMSARSQKEADSIVEHVVKGSGVPYWVLPVYSGAAFLAECRVLPIDILRK